MSEQQETLKFVIVGHVDHGKSTLIGRLLYDTGSLTPDRIQEAHDTSSEQGRTAEFAYLLDHLEEERAQGITIDTTQVFFSSEKRHYVIIDAPGHLEFLKNMITGASQAEAGVLIVDVEEGLREQTRRHSFLLGLLGIKEVIVVFNKMDLIGFAEEKFQKLKEEIVSFLASINVRPRFCIPICALEGENIIERSGKMPWYEGLSFLEGLDELKKRSVQGDEPLLLPVQDVYPLDGEAVIVGRVEAGRIEQEAEIEILPSRKRTRVREVKKYMDEVQSACRGESIGITTHDGVRAQRGEVICSPEHLPHLTQAFGATIFWMSQAPYKKGQSLTLRCATQATHATIETIQKRIDSSTLKTISDGEGSIRHLEVAEVLIKTKAPLVVKEFNDTPELGRFILVDGEVPGGDENTCCGGIVTSIK